MLAAIAHRALAPIRAAAVAAIAASAPTATPAGAADLDAETLADRADLAAAYMAGVQNADGTFGYEFDFVLGEFLDRDNIVRQAGV